MQLLLTTSFRFRNSLNHNLREILFQLNWTPEIVEDFLKQRDTWIAFTSVSGIIFLVTLCLFIFLRKRILIAIALIEEGSKAVGHMFSSLFFPIIPWLFQVILSSDWSISQVIQHSDWLIDN